jgi:phosphomannomutase
MPVIARFYGIIIAMFFADHNPPHFHARYGGFQVVIKIDDLAILTGEMPTRALGLIMEWAARH